MRMPVVAALLGMLAGCQKQERHQRNQPVTVVYTTASAAPEPAPSASPAPEVPLLELSTVGPAGVPGAALAVGKLHTALRWRDGAGDNLLVMAKLDIPSDASEFVRIDHFRETPAGLTLVRSVRDGGQCLDDGGVDYRDQAIGLTDVDADGIGEITFAYRLICTTDVSPGEVKLLLLENGDKYILRGIERLTEDGQKLGGQFTPDGFGAAPAGFLEHAHVVWERIIDREPI